MNYKIEPIPVSMADEVRRSMVSPQYKSLAAVASVANGYGPCRSCLRVFDEGVDRRIYFTYNAFEGLSDLPAPGPVFIHEEDCTAFDGEFPEDLRKIPIFLEAYGSASRLIERVRMEPGGVESQLETLLSMDRVEFVNLRNAEAGCHIAKAVRAG